MKVLENASPMWLTANDIAKRAKVGGSYESCQILIGIENIEVKTEKAYRRTHLRFYRLKKNTNPSNNNNNNSSELAQSSHSHSLGGV